jgi:hypothetical protein
MKTLPNLGHDSVGSVFDASDDGSVGERDTLTHTRAKDGDFRAVNSEILYKQRFFKTAEIFFNRGVWWEEFTSQPPRQTPGK